MAKIRIAALAALALIFTFALAAYAEDVNWSSLQNALRQAVAANNVEAVKKAVIPIVNAGGKQAVDIVLDVLDKVPKSQDEIYWMLVNAITTVTDPQALSALADYMCERKDSTARDLLFGLQTNRVIEVVKLLGRVLEKCPGDMQKMAIEQLVNIEKDECVEALIAGLDSVRDKAIKGFIIEALRILTGADCGESVSDWKQYWQTTKNEGLPKGEETSGGGGSGYTTGAVSRYGKEKRLGMEAMPPVAALVITAHCANASAARIVYDNLESVLSQMGVKNTVVDRYDFEDSKYEIPKDTIAIFINCTQIHPHCVCPKCHPGTTKSNRMFP